MPTCRPALDFVKKMVDKQESLLLAVSAIYTSSRKWIKARTQVYSCFSPSPGVRHMRFCFLGIISYCLDAHERGFANILSSTGVAGMV